MLSVYQRLWSVRLQWAVFWATFTHGSASIHQVATQLWAITLSTFASNQLAIAKRMPIDTVECGTSVIRHTGNVLFTDRYTAKTEPIIYPIGLFKFNNQYR